MFKNLKKKNEYIAKEAFNFPSFCFILFAMCLFIGFKSNWSIDTIIASIFFGILVVYYIFKYIHYGRDYLKINSEGITIKESSKTTSIPWDEIINCTVYYDISRGGVIRHLDIHVKSTKKDYKYIPVFLSGKYCRNKKVVEAIKTFGGEELFDSQASKTSNSYFLKMSFITVIALIAISVYYLFKD